MTVAPLIVLGNLLPEPEQQWWDSNGILLVGGKIYTYASDAITPKATYQDAAQTILNTNPIVVGSDGRTQIYGRGNYTFAVFDQFGVQQYTQPTADTSASLDISDVGLQMIQQTSTADILSFLGIAASEAPFGTILAFAGQSAPTGWALCFGQELSRSANPNLFAAIGTTWGAGNGSTTFNVPDLRGRAWAGADAMGGSAANRLTTDSIGVTATVGAVGGDQLLMGHFHSSTFNEGGGHTHPQFYTGAFPGSGVPEGGVSNAVGPGTQSPDMHTGAATIGASITIEPAGNGTAQNVQPTGVGNFIIQLG